MKNIISANANRLILVVNNAIWTNTTAMINNDNDNFFIKLVCDYVVKLHNNNGF